MLEALGGGEGLGYLLGGAGSLLGALGGLSQKKSNNNGWQNAANVWMADRAFGQQVALMKHQAEINSPANQMKRYKEAGLNPNLIYGQISSGNVSMPSGVNSPIIRDYNQSDRKYSKLDAFSGVLKAISDAMDNLNTARAQKNYLDAKTETERAKANKLNSQADLKNSKDVIDATATKNFKIIQQKRDFNDLQNSNRDLLNEINSLRQKISNLENSPKSSEYSKFIRNYRNRLSDLQFKYNDNLDAINKIIYNNRDYESFNFGIPGVAKYNSRKSF